MESTAAEMQSPKVKTKTSVRWPFRILAALVVLAGGVAIVGEVLAGSSHQEFSRWQLLASLPGVLWLVQLAWYAVIQGKSPSNPSWPFSTDRVLFCYMAVWVATYFFA